MFGRLFKTRRGHDAILTAAALCGLVMILTVDSPRTGTIVFLAVTAVESGVFSLVYGLRSDWRTQAAARAVFWAVFAYFWVATQLLTMYIWPQRFWWTYDLRELLYLAFALAGLNLVLTMMRLLGRRVYAKPRGGQ